MSILKFFFGQKAAAASDNNNSGRKSKKATSKRSSHKAVERKQPAEVQDERVEIVKRIIECWNNHDLQECKKYLTNNFVSQFKDLEFEFDDFAAEVQNLFDAIPDFTFKYKSITLQEDNVVAVNHVIPGGHHTGKPFAFGPFAPIEPKGTYVETDPETLYFHFQGGKVCKHRVVAHGEITGPHGLYTLLGGFPLM